MCLPVLLKLEFDKTIDVDVFIHPYPSEFRVRPVSHLIGLQIILWYFILNQMSRGGRNTILNVFSSRMRVKKYVHIYLRSLNFDLLFKH